MASDARRSRAGQATAEFVVAILAIVLLVAATVEFLPVFLDNIGLLKEVREEAGTRAVSAESGISAADRKDEFGFEIPGILEGDGMTSGAFSERVHMPAANLAPGETVRIPGIAGMVETLRYANRDGTSEFLSGLLAMDKDQALARVKGAMAGAGWTAHEIQADDAIVFSVGDPAAPSAVAAAHAGYSDDGVSACITVIARTAGAAR
jgi:predicted transcriptional regulator